MKVVVQRVQASVTVDGQLISSIGAGLLVTPRVEEGDTKEDFDYILKKVLQLRIFNDQNGVMNLDIKQVDGG